MAPPSCETATATPLGCGFGNPCATCSLRLALEDTLQHGTVHRDVDYHATWLRDGQPRPVALLGSTVLLGTMPQPHLLLCGHIHEARGESSIGSCRVVNVGELRRGFGALIEIGEEISVEWIGGDP